jgi:hypothetical protein
VNYLPSGALNHDPSDLCLLSSYKYRREPLAPGYVQHTHALLNPFSPFFFFFFDVCVTGVELRPCACYVGTLPLEAHLQFLESFFDVPY